MSILKNKFTVFCMLFLLVSCSNKSSNSLKAETLNHFIKSIYYHNKSAEIIDAQGGPFYPQETIDQKVKHEKLSLQEAQFVNIDILNEIYSGWGDNFAKFQEGLTKSINGYENKDFIQIAEGDNIINKWADWYNNNVNQIKK